MWSEVFLLGGSNLNSWLVITPSYRHSLNNSLIVSLNDSDSSVSENVVALPAVSEPERRPNVVQNPQEIIIDEEIILPIQQ